MRVLAVCAHPDDMEIECAGTLLKCKERGDEVFVCHMSSGSLGHVVIMPEELKKIRLQEAQNSGAMVGFNIIYGGFDDLEIYADNREARDKLVDIIRYVRPDFIITHYPQDYMPDHEAVSKLTFDASFTATLPHYTDYPHVYSAEGCEPAALVPIFYFAPSGGFNFQPTEYVDITDYIETKIKMLECHESQYKWLADHTNKDVGEETRAVSRFRGIQCGVKHAEGFTQCLASLKVSTKRYLP